MSDAPDRQISRRRLVRSAGTAAWTAPVILAASSAPAYAGGPSLGAPAVMTSNLRVVEAPDSGISMDASMTFTNNGTAAATSLSVVINIDVEIGAFNNTISMLTPGWTVSGPTENPVNNGRDFTFARAAGIDIGPTNAEPLSFRFTAFNPGTGTLTVFPPATDPAGANTGATTTFGLP